jgi:TonB family protein
MYRVWFATLFLLLAAASLSAQTAAASPPELPKDPQAMLAAAAPFYDWDAASVHPWHLKASYQMFDGKGNATGQGTFEYWWASPTVYRTTWTRGSIVHSDWHTANGKTAYVDTGASLEFFEYRLKSALVSPFPAAADYDPEKTWLKKDTVTFGQVKAPCVMIVPSMPMHGRVLNLPMGMFPTYCFDPKIAVLLARTSFGSVSEAYASIVKFQDRLIARSVAEYENGHRILSATIDTLELLDPSDAALTPPPEAHVPGTSAAEIPASVMAGRRVKGPNPVYPQDAKEARAEGEVVLKALIGRDGHIHDLKVVSAAYPTLVASALVAVAQWQYQPYLLNGEPVEVQTEIRVIYSLGQ